MGATSSKVGEWAVCDGTGGNEVGEGGAGGGRGGTQWGPPPPATSWEKGQPEVGQGQRGGTREEGLWWERGQPVGAASSKLVVGMPPKV